LNRGALELRGLNTALAQAASADLKSDLVRHDVPEGDGGLAVSTKDGATALATTIRGAVLNARRAR
jgi:NAD kinase